MRDPSPPRGGNLMNDGDERCVYAQAVQQQQAWMWEEKLPPPKQLLDSKSQFPAARL